MGTWGDQSHVTERDGPPAWSDRERGGYWRQYQLNYPHHGGRGPKGYQRSDERMREEICERMTDDPYLDASEIEIDVKQGEVTLGGTVTSREQKRRAEDVADSISGVTDVVNQLRIVRNPVTEASGKGTPSKSTSSSTA